MKKYSYKDKNYDIQDRLHHKGIHCISDRWLKWAKKYLNRSDRRRDKQALNKQRYD